MSTLQPFSLPILVRLVLSGLLKPSTILHTGVDLAVEGRHWSTVASNYCCLPTGRGLTRPPSESCRKGENEGEIEDRAAKAERRTRLRETAPEAAGVVE